MINREYPAAERVSKISPIEEKEEKNEKNFSSSDYEFGGSRCGFASAVSRRHYSNRRNTPRSELPSHRNLRRYRHTNKYVLPGDFIYVSEGGGTPYIKGPWFGVVGSVQDSGNLRVIPVWNGQKITFEDICKDTKNTASYKWHTPISSREMLSNGLILAHYDKFAFIDSKIVPVNYEERTVEGGDPLSFDWAERMMARKEGAVK